jgi:hypothetical protein
MFKLTPNSISYRDTAARVVKEGETYFRYISYSYKSEYDHIMESGLYKKLVDKGFLIPHKEVEFKQDKENTNTSYYTNVYKKLLPYQIDFQTYPFEWSYGQWRKAIFCFLRINEIALEFGMILKDASPYNFFIEKGNAILLDTSSFIFFNKGDKWIAYRQFCSEFFSPFVLMKYNGERWSRISRSHTNGFPLDFVSKQLPLKSWFNLSCLMHIHLHSKYSNAEGSTEDYSKKRKFKRGFTKEKLLSLIKLLKQNTKKWEIGYQYEKHWKNYYEKDIENEAYIQNKKDIIEDWLAKIRPNRVIDLGANTGYFSFLSSQYAKKVISIEEAEYCIDMIDKICREKNINNIISLKNDISQPTPNLGVLNNEYNCIYKRAKSELVLALAITHHLFFKNKLNFTIIAEIFANFSESYLIVEYIDIEDSKIKLLNTEFNVNRIYYKEENFVKAFLKHFKLLKCKHIKNSKRNLYLFKKF